MAQVILMPKMSDTMEEGVIAKWLKKVGDQVKSGEILAEVETDKATMELECYETGTILYLAIEEGGSIKVDGLLAIVGKQGEDIQGLIAGQNTTTTPAEPKISQAEITPSENKVNLSSLGNGVKIITMPKMSDTMEEGVIANWQKKVGDAVKSGEVLAEVETDKATMELESYDSGTLLYQAVPAGGSVKVDGLLAILGEPGTDIQAVIAQLSNGSASESKQVVENKASQTNTTTETPKQEIPQEIEKQNSNGRIKISPLAKALAKAKGIDPSSIKGSGDHGRIVKRDIENYNPAQNQVEKTQPVQNNSTSNAISMTPGIEGFEDVALSQMRKTIAKRLSESMFSAPHFYLTMEINMDQAMAARQQMNETSPVKISFNDMVVKAASMALRKNPKINASWLGDKIRYYKHIHVGIAVAVEEGLLVPVVRHADAKSLSQIASETKELAQKAKDKKLQPKDWEGNTFSISNLGMFGIEEFTAIINPPDACIMAVGGIKEVVIVKDGQFAASHVMKVTLSCDHRVVDGALGAAFLQTFKELLEYPVRMLI